MGSTSTGLRDHLGTPSDVVSYCALLLGGCATGRAAALLTTTSAAPEPATCQPSVIQYSKKPIATCHGQGMDKSVQQCCYWPGLLLGGWRPPFSPANVQLRCMPGYNSMETTAIREQAEHGHVPCTARCHPSVEQCCYWPGLLLGGCATGWVWPPAVPTPPHA